MSGAIIPLIFLAVVVVIGFQTFKVVPQQEAYIVERWGRYYRTLTPGLRWLVPIMDKVAYRHTLKEIPLDVPSQVC
ncbi:MAG: paraslipin, partial [Neisseriaceae bacterium]|nr:paraslipin [Neisseriaceae bacterium]